MNDTVIILGTAPTLSITPWDLPDADYWACSPVITHSQQRGHRLDVLFEMHEIEYWSDPKITERFNKYISENPNTVIYMQRKAEAIHNSETYPLQDVQAYVNHPRMRNYFTSTIAYMYALAIMRGYKKIELYGVHMASAEEEYSLQRSCLETWIAFGWGRGVDFYLPEESDVMHSNSMYGYEQSKGVLLKAIQYKDGLSRGVTDLKAKMERLHEEYWMQKGGEIGLDNFIKELKKQGMG